MAPCWRWWLERSRLCVARERGFSSTTGWMWLSRPVRMACICEAIRLPPRRVRAAVPPSFLIGRSVHSRDEIAQVSDEGGVDYLLFGTVFATASKPDRHGNGNCRPASRRSTRPKDCLCSQLAGSHSTTPVNWRRTGCSGFAAIGQFADGPEESLRATVTAALGAWENPGS